MKKSVFFLTLSMIMILLTFPACIYASEVKVNQDIKIFIDGKVGTYTVSPITVNDRVLLPLRELLLNLGVPNDNEHIIWNEKEESITIQNNSIEIYLRVNDTNAKLNDQSIKLDTEPVIYEEKTYIPARFVAQCFGKGVEWDGKTNSVYIGQKDTEEMNMQSNSTNETEKKTGAIKWERVGNIAFSYTDKIISGNGKFIVLADDGLLTSIDGVIWVKYKTDKKYFLNSAIWNGKQFVAVGMRGMILKSNDGEIWDESNNPIKVDIYDIAWNGNSYIAVGEGNTILKSVDGQDWNASAKKSKANIKHLIWGGNKFVGIAESNKILTSVDGEEWIERESNTDMYLEGVVWNGKEFVAYGGYEGLDGGTVISQDGITWQKYERIIEEKEPAENILVMDGKKYVLEQKNGMIWDGERFVAVGCGGSILTSNDGVNWVDNGSHICTNDSLQNVAYSNGRYVAIGFQGVTIVGKFTTNKNDSLIMDSINEKDGFPLSFISTDVNRKTGWKGDLITVKVKIVDKSYNATESVGQVYLDYKDPMGKVKSITLKYNNSSEQWIGTISADEQGDWRLFGVTIDDKKRNKVHKVLPEDILKSNASMLDFYMLSDQSP